MRLQTNGALICEALLTKIKGVFHRTDWEERCGDLREHACLYGELAERTVLSTTNWGPVGLIPQWGTKENEWVTEGS